jgi:hypothetical protein
LDSLFPFNKVVLFLCRRKNSTEGKDGLILACG